MSHACVQLPAGVPETLGGPEAEPVVAAVSGGSDSVALLLVMHDARQSGAIPSLHLAHLNHRIRGRKADNDAEFVRKLAEALHIPVTTGEIDVPAVARQRRISLEHAARECRYEFLEKTARELGARWVALGHTADDQLETVLHNLLRGTGIHGLAGMPASRPIAPDSRIRIIRPLIEYTRDELTRYLETRGTDYCTDHTNLDVTYTRNRIRHQLVPALEASWPDIRADVTAFTSELGKLDELLEDRAREWVDAHAGIPAGTPGARGPASEVGLDELNELEEPVVSYVIRRLIADTLGDLRRIDEIHVRMILDLASAGSTGASLNLPRRLIVRRGYGSLRFEVGEQKPPRVGRKAVAEAAPRSSQPLAAVELAVPGETQWGRWRFQTKVLEGAEIRRELIDLSGGPDIPEFQSPPEDLRGRMRVFIRQLREIAPGAVEYLDYDRVGEEQLIVRGRLPGDRFIPLGAPGQKKLKDFLIRRKVPRAERDDLPLIVAGERVLAVAGLGISDTVALTEDTRRILSISSYLESERK